MVVTGGDDIAKASCSPSSVQLKNVVTTTVSPAQPAQPSVECELTDLDLMLLEIYSRFLLFYDRPPHLSFSQAVNGLKDSLSKALVQYYSFAGRLVNEDGQTRLLCNDAGAIFTSAEVDAPMREACRISSGAIFQALPWLTGLVQAGIDPSQLLPKASDESGLPCLVVQVTGFGCGGLAVSVTWTHTVADGYSLVRFLQSWSEISRGIENSVVTAPDNGRSQVLQAAKLYDSPNGESVSSLFWRRHDDPVPKPVTRSTTMKEFDYTEEAIQRLKKHIAETAEGSSTSHLSTMDCITAHLWQSVTRARFPAAAAGASDDALMQEPVHYSTYADARRRRKGSAGGLVPENYFGNTLLSTKTAPTTPAELLSRPLAVAASLIRESVQEVGLQSFQALLGLAREHGRGRIKHGIHRPGRDFGTSSWVGLPIYQLDFWGGCRPFLATRNFPPNPYLDGFAWLLPSSSAPRNIAVQLYISEAVVAKLVTDPQFSKFAIPAN